MGPTLTIRIQNAVAIDDLVIFVLEQRKIELSRESLLQLLDELLRFLMAVDADREDLCGLFLFFG